MDDEKPDPENEVPHLRKLLKEKEDHLLKLEDFVAELAEMKDNREELLFIASRLMAGALAGDTVKGSHFESVVDNCIEGAKMLIEKVSKECSLKGPTKKKD